MSEFHFLRPYWFLALIPVAIILWQLWHQKYHSRSWQAVCDPHLLPHLLINSGSPQKQWPIIVSGFMSLLVILALAGPVWEKSEQPVFRKQSALVIVLDLSRSMDANDIKPSRLTRARHKIIDILKQRKEGQTAMLVYAADSYTVSPLTEDSNTIISMVKTLNTDLMPVQGSKPDKALQRATDLLKQAGAVHGHIILITDGIQKSQAKTLAEQVTQHGHQLSVLGAGTEEGAPIAMESGGFLKDKSGDIVVPKLTSATLIQLARLGGGRYHTLSADENDLDYLLAGMDTQQFDTQQKETTFIADRWQEQGAWLLLIVLPFAALAFRKGYLIMLIIICLPALPQPANALEWDELWQRPEQTAAKQLQQNNSTETLPSADLFNDPEWKASAHYRAGEYPQAVEALQGIDKADALYNKGNALAKMGKLPEALESYKQALEKEPQHADAKYNSEEVEKKLKQQESDESKEDDKKSSDEKQDDDKEKQQEESSDDQKENEPSEEQSDNKNDQSNDKQDEQDQQDKKPEQEEAKESDKQDPDKKETEQEKQAKKEKSEDEKDPEQKASDLKEQQKQKEIDQATEQWLRRIPDDPGGLLRRKFQYEHQLQQQRNQTRRRNNNEQPAW